MHRTLFIEEYHKDKDSSGTVGKGYRREWYRGSDTHHNYDPEEPFFR